jgi:DivIVA domain-containing protein
VARNRRKDRETGGFEGEAGATSGARARLTPVEVQQKVFRLAFRGYNERDVDEFLDRVTEDLAALHEENKRLLEQVTEGGTGGNASGADRQAEAIVRQAREHAARLVEEAERRTASTGGGTPEPGLPGTFLLQERQFLQQMATLIQGHAQRLKEEARRARPTPEEPSTGDTPEPPTSEPGITGAGGAAAGAAAVGGAAAMGGAAAREDEPPTPAPEPPSPSPQEPSRSEPPPPAAEPPPPAEATAPWSPIEERSTGQGERASSGEQGDQLVSAWENAFSGDSVEPGSAEEGTKREDGGEPSLRELFWGEES